MKIIKTLFLISLFNFLVVGAVVLALKNKPRNNNQDTNNFQIPTTNNQTETTATPTQNPPPSPPLTLLRQDSGGQVKRGSDTSSNSDPFAGIFMAPPTELRAGAPTAGSTRNNTTSNNAGNTNSGQTVNQTVQPTTPPPAVSDSRCIITVDGGRYDVTTFRSKHSGGDMFKCGMDMSATFHGQHPDSFLNKMGQYKI